MLLYTVEWRLFVALFGVLLLTLYTAATSILCVRCDSTEEVVPGSCEHNPRGPNRCPVVTGTPKQCLIAREYDKHGKQIRFVRDCTTASMAMGEDVCRDMPVQNSTGSNSKIPAKICVIICDTDGCNGGQRSKASITVFFMALASLAYSRLSS